MPSGYCNVCGRSFDSLQTLLDHVNSNHTAMDHNWSFDEDDE